MVVLAGALDFGSSWRDELRDFHGKGTWPTVPWPDVRMEGQLHPLFVMRHEVKQGVESMSNLCPELKAATWTTVRKHGEWFTYLQVPTI